MGGQSASIGERVGWGAFPALTDCVSTGFIIQLVDTADKLSFLVAATLKKILSPRWNPRSNSTCGESVCEGGGVRRAKQDLLFALAAAASFGFDQLTKF